MSRIQILIGQDYKLMTDYSNSAPVRLGIYLKQNRKYQIFIGYPLANPREWIRILNFNQTELSGKNGEKFSLDDVSSFIVTYPSGEIIDGELVLEPLPIGLFYIQSQERRKAEILIPTNLEAGNKLLKVIHKEVTERRKGYYSTTLTNLSSEKIRVKKFAGYGYRSGIYILNTITGGYFSQQHFQEWYGVDEDGWLKPGQMVTDPNNYGGRNGYWVYFCVTQSGEEFVAGALFPAANCWWKLW